MGVEVRGITGVEDHMWKRMGVVTKKCETRLSQRVEKGMRSENWKGVEKGTWKRTARKELDQR